MNGWIIIYLNRDPFAVKRDDYIEMVAAVGGDPIKITEWVESHGIFLRNI